MKKTGILFIFLLILFSGCSQKEMSDGASDIGNDISEFGEKIFKVRE